MIVIYERGHELMDERTREMESQGFTYHKTITRRDTAESFARVLRTRPNNKVIITTEYDESGVPFYIVWAGDKE